MKKLLLFLVTVLTVGYADNVKAQLFQQYTSTISTQTALAWGQTNTVSFGFSTNKYCTNSFDPEITLKYAIKFYLEDAAGNRFFLKEVSADVIKAPSGQNDPPFPIGNYSVTLPATPPASCLHPGTIALKAILTIKEYDFYVCCGGQTTCGGIPALQQINGCGLTNPPEVEIGQQNVICDPVCVGTLTSTTPATASILTGTNLINRTVCYGQTFTLGNTPNVTGGTPPYTYSWTEKGKSYIPALPTANPQVVAYNTTTYVLSAKDNAGCEVSKEVVITVNNAPTSFDFSSSDGQVMSIKSTELWSSGGTIKVKGGIIIRDGGVLTISNGTKVEFTRDNSIPVDLGVPNCGVMVEPGGVLNITGGAVLGGSSACGAMWDGIQVLGNTNTGIGRLNISTGGTIQDAIQGVSLFRLTEPYSSGTQPEYGSGEIMADGAIFLNNRISIVFAGHSLINNTSRIKNCTFSCTAPLKDLETYNGHGSYVHIRLDKVYGVGIFGGNIFNGNSFTSDPLEKGTAILSYDAGYDVVGYTNYPAPDKTANNFSGLYKGIDTYSSGGIGNKIRIRDNIFSNTLQGLTLNSTTLTEIGLNTFNVPAGISTNDNNRAYGVYSYGATGILLTDNIFAASTPNQFTYGVVVRNAVGTVGMEYKNTFNGIFQVASQSEQDNSSLKVGCNVYNGISTFDWAVTSGTLGIQGACTTPLTPAGNSFHSCTAGGNNYSQIYVDPAATLTYFTTADSGPVCHNAMVNICPLIATTGCPDDKLPIYTPLVIVKPCRLCPLKEILTKLQLPDLTGPIVRGITTSKTIHDLVNQGEISNAIQLIKNTGLIEDRKALIPTYLLEGNCDLAKSELNNIPATGIENAAFHKLFDMLVNACSNGRPVARLTAQEKAIVAQVGAGNTRAAINAQSLMAAMNSTTYNRLPESLHLRTRHSSEGEEAQTETIAIDNNGDHFSIVPNPTSGSTKVYYSFKNANPGKVVISDLLGKQIKSYLLNGSNGEYMIDATEFSNGIYIIQLSDAQNRAIATQKLIINN